MAPSDVFTNMLFILTFYSFLFLNVCLDLMVGKLKKNKKLVQKSRDWLVC